MTDEKKKNPQLSKQGNRWDSSKKKKGEMKLFLKKLRLNALKKKKKQKGERIFFFFFKKEFY